MASALGELVEGYSQAQELKMKKAREIANQQADKFEREYKLSQAKQQSMYQAQQIDLEKARVGIEQKAQERLTKRDADLADNNRAKNLIAQEGLTLRRYLGDAKRTVDEQRDARAKFFKTFDELVLKMEPDKAAEITAWAHSNFGDILQPAAGGQVAPPPQGADGYLELLNSLHGGVATPAPKMPGQQGIQAQQPGPNMLSTVRPPSETTSAIHTLSGLIGQSLASSMQKDATGKAREDKLKAETEVIKGMEDTRKLSAQIMNNLHRAQTDVAKGHADLIKKQVAAFDVAEELREAHLIAENVAIYARIDDAKKRLALSQKEFSLKEEEYKLKNTKTREDGRQKIQAAMGRYMDIKDKLSKEKLALTAQMGKTEKLLQMNPPYIETLLNKATKKKYTPQEAQNARDAHKEEYAEQGRRMKELLSLQSNADHEYSLMEQSLWATPKTDDTGKKVTTHGGETDPKATAAAAAAARANAEKARRASDAANRASGETLPHNTARNPSRHAAPEGKVLKLKSGKSFKVERVPD